uniref:Uncharacterized protein n=1 Tax=Oryza punctata TaxID=4537 RepID=A0A0E0K4R3_ORYPU
MAELSMAGCVVGDDSDGCFFLGSPWLHVKVVVAAAVGIGSNRGRMAVPLSSRRVRTTRSFYLDLDPHGGNKNEPDVVCTVEDAAIGDELQRGACMTENAAAGDELRCGTDGEGWGSRRRAPVWDVDGGTTGDDALLPDPGYLASIT